MPSWRERNLREYNIESFREFQKVSESTKFSENSAISSNYIDYLS